MKPYSAKRAERKLRESLKSAATAKFAEGKGIRAEAKEAFKRPPYQMRKRNEMQNKRMDTGSHKENAGS